MDSDLTNPNLLTVWWADGPEPRAAYCEVFGYPNKDTAGATMNNVCFRTREEAWDYIGRNLDAQEAFVARDLAEARRRLAELHAKAAEVVEARHRYRQARERDGGARG